MSAEIWLVIITTIGTGGVALLAALQQNRFAERRRQVERREALADRNVANSRSHALALHTALQELLDLGLDARHEHGGLPDQGRARSMISAIRGNYLLIEDDSLRETVSHGLTIVTSAWSRNIDPNDWRSATASTTFVLAAYLRGSAPPARYVDELRELRAQYPAPESLPEADVVSEVRESGESEPGEIPPVASP